MKKHRADPFSGIGPAFIRNFRPSRSRGRATKAGDSRYVTGGCQRTVATRQKTLPYIYMRESDVPCTLPGEAVRKAPSRSLAPGSCPRLGRQYRPSGALPGPNGPRSAAIPPRYQARHGPPPSPVGPSRQEPFSIREHLIEGTGPLNLDFLATEPLTDAHGCWVLDPDACFPGKAWPSKPGAERQAALACTRFTFLSMSFFRLACEASTK